MLCFVYLFIYLFLKQRTGKDYDLVLRSGANLEIVEPLVESGGMSETKREGEEERDGGEDGRCKRIK